MSVLLIDTSFNITSMIQLLHFDILSVEVGISAILPFSCFLVHHAEKVSASRVAFVATIPMRCNRALAQPNAGREGGL